MSGPPLDPPEENIPTRPCSLCGKDMEHDGRWGWRCEEECGGGINDEPYELSYDEICLEDR